VVVNFFFYLLPLRCYKAKRVKTHCFLEGVGQFEPRFQGKGVISGEYFLVSRKVDNILLSGSAICTVLHPATCSRFDSIPACNRWTKLL